jgi:hypothetical protein
VVLKVVRHHLTLVVAEEAALIVVQREELQALLYNGFELVIVHHEAVRWRCLTGGKRKRIGGGLVDIEVDEVGRWAVRARRRHAW